MDCKINSNQILDFNFGQLNESARAQVEQHLVSCPSCLQEFFSLKKDVELGKHAQVEPSKSIRLKLLNEFSKSFPGNSKVLPLTFWQKPKLIAAGFAAAAIILIGISLFSPLSPFKKEKTAPENLIHTISESIDSGGDSPSHINIL